MGNNLSRAGNAQLKRESSRLSRLQGDSQEAAGHTQSSAHIIESAFSIIPRTIQTGDFENTKEAKGTSISLSRLNQPEELASHSQTARPPESANFKIYGPLQIEGLNGNYIRVLTLLLGAHGSKMSCELDIVYLDQHPRHEALQYNALSYAWGNPALSRLIWVNGKVMAISSNLESALEHLRSTREPRKLWIDAICIDQGNMRERSHQVLLMKRIYLRAERVLIWLGPQDTDSDLAFDVVEALSSKANPETLDRVNKYGEADLVAPLITRLGEEPMMALRATFSEREWWKRIWVIQEVVSARSASIVCGRRSISWSLLNKILHRSHDIVLMKHPKLEVREQLASTMHSAIIFTAIRDQIRQQQMEDNILFFEKGTYKMNLCGLLALFEGNFCTDPRDRIYALQNIIDEKRWTIIPDYRKSVIEVFSEGTKAMVADADLNVLAYGYRSSELPGQRDFKTRPSWVVDWSIPRKFSTLEIGSMNEPLYHAGDNMMVSASTEVRNSETALLPEIDPFWLLRINGVFDDEVAEVLYRVEMESDNYKEWFQKWAPHERGLTKIELDKYFQTLMLDVRRPTGWPVRLKVEDIRYCRSMFVMWTQHPGWKALAQWPFTLTYWPESFGSFSECLGDHLRGWAFCTTKKGRLGWVPNPSQAGDIICRAPRSTLPLVIRKARIEQDEIAIKWNVGDSFELIGTAYISGIMDGFQSTSYDQRAVVNLV
jgi:hypothetical protein